MIKCLKGVQWMPWHAQAMKDVARCDKLRGGVSNLRSVDFRMGKPTSKPEIPNSDEFVQSVSSEFRFSGFITRYFNLNT